MRNKDIWNTSDRSKDPLLGNDYVATFGVKNIPIYRS